MPNILTWLCIFNISFHFQLSFTSFHRYLPILPFEYRQDLHCTNNTENDFFVSFHLFERKIELSIDCAGAYPLTVAVWITDALILTRRHTLLHSALFGFQQERSTHIPSDRLKHFLSAISSIM